jgi:predicted GIY-YIG superfamily endonuclease
MPAKGAKRKPAQGPFVCYVLQKSGKTYTGQTNNFARRLRQHRGHLRGGARCTSRANAVDTSGAPWSPMFRVTGLATLRAALQFEYAMKRRHVPLAFRAGEPPAPAAAAAARRRQRGRGKRVATRGPAGRVRQLEYLLGLGRLNDEPHSHFASNSIAVECHLSVAQYLAYAHLTETQFLALRRSQRVPFTFVAPV